MGLIPKAVFYERLNSHCKPCSEWDGVCLRGHALQSPTGCPLRKFEPILAADYDADNGRTVRPPSGGGCSGCGAKVSADDLPELTWTQVLKNFAESMVVWIKAGLPLASAEEHAQRYALCKSCQPHFHGYYCRLCKCIVYTKSKVKTEFCPIAKW